MIDYAHTPDALAKALAALRPLVEARRLQGSGGKLWVVFGAGGDRDSGKRAAMGAAAAHGADVLQRPVLATNRRCGKRPR